MHLPAFGDQPGNNTCRKSLGREETAKCAVGMQKARFSKGQS